MPDAHEAFPARPPYDSATAALLECIEPLGIFRAMTVQNIPSWRAPAEEVRAEFLRRHPDVVASDADVIREDGTRLPVAIVRTSQDAAGGRPGLRTPLLSCRHGTIVARQGRRPEGPPGDWGDNPGSFRGSPDRAAGHGREELLT